MEDCFPTDADADIIIKTSGAFIPAKIRILETRSVYFRSLFTSGMLSGISKDIRGRFIIPITTFEHPIVISVLKYIFQCYTSPLELLNVIIYCDYFGFDTMDLDIYIKDMHQKYYDTYPDGLIEYLKSTPLEFDTMLIISIAQHFDARKLLSVANTRILVGVLYSDDLNVSSEHEVLQFLEDWVKRYPHLQEDANMLLELIRYPTYIDPIHYPILSTLSNSKIISDESQHFKPYNGS